MSDILFSHSYFMRFDPKQWDYMQPYPPLGTIYAASVMRDSGFTVALFDTMFVERAEAVKQKLEEEKPKYFVIYDDGFNWLTKMCLTNMRHAAWDMAKIAKAKGCTVIASSSDSTDHHEEYLKNGVDYVILGEAEETLKELIQQLEQNEPIVETQGLAFQKDGEYIKTQKRPVITHLDDLPFPAWDLVDVESYKSRWKKAHGYFSLNQVTTRGCPYKCNWCAKPIYGNRYNSRSPKKAVEEIELITKNYKPDHIWFSDDIFGLTPKWVQEFRDLLSEKGISIKYKIQSRVDLLLVEDTAEALAKSGCDTIWLGAESGSQHILDAMDKGTKIEQIKEARNVLKKFGIKCGFFLQFGYPGETKEDIDKTIQMVKDLMPDEIGVSVSYPLPGTKFYEKVKSELNEKANWTDSDDLDLMFNNNYSSNYYKVLQRYLHKVLQRKKGQEAIKLMFSKPKQLNGSKIKAAIKTLYYAPASYSYKRKLEKLS